MARTRPLEGMDEEPSGSDDEKQPVDLSNMIEARPSQQVLFLCGVCKTARRSPKILICLKCGINSMKNLLLEEAPKLKLGGVGSE
jgi:hypothetical protein